MRKIIGFRTLCVGLGIWVGTVVVSAQGEFKALPWSQSTAYNSYLMRDVHRQFASRQLAIQQAFTSPAGMQEYLGGHWWGSQGEGSRKYERGSGATDLGP